MQQTERPCPLEHSVCLWGCLQVSLIGLQGLMLTYPSGLAGTLIGTVTLQLCPLQQIQVSVLEAHADAG